MNQQQTDNPFAKRIGKKRLEHWQKISLLLALYDMAAVAGAYFLAL